MARRYHLRPVDEAKLHNVKMKAIGFDKKNKAIRTWVILLFQSVYFTRTKNYCSEILLQLCGLHQQIVSANCS
jgi:hypothetical protein